MQNSVESETLRIGGPVSEPWLVRDGCLSLYLPTFEEAVLGRERKLPQALEGETSSGQNQFWQVSEV